MSLSNTATEITLCDILCDIMSYLMGNVPKNIIVKISGGGFEVGIWLGTLLLNLIFLSGNTLSKECYVLFKLKK